MDGALAALLVDLGFPPEVGNALFLIARVTGLAAHAFEEMTCQRPMRQIHPPITGTMARLRGNWSELFEHRCCFGT